MAAGAVYRFLREAPGDGTGRLLTFARTSGQNAEEAQVSVGLALTDEGWRVNAAEY